MSTLSSLRTNHCLEVEVVEAKDLNPTNFFSSTSSDSFCELWVRDQKPKQTQVQFATLTPKWEEKIQFELPENPEEETLFVNVWGKHVISRNTFIGRLEIPVCLVIERDHSNTSTITYRENVRLEKWFKLLPNKAQKPQFSQVTGWLKLAFEYKYVPFVPANSPDCMVAPPIPNDVAPAGAKIVYQCPGCSSFFSPEEIQVHMNSCKQAQVGPVPPQANYSAPTMANAPYSPAISPASTPIHVASGDASVPSGFTADPSQPAPNSPPTYVSPPSFPPNYSSNPFDVPASTEVGFSPARQRSSSGLGESGDAIQRKGSYPNVGNHQPEESPYSAPSYNFSTPY